VWAGRGVALKRKLIDSIVDFLAAPSAATAKDLDRHGRIDWWRTYSWLDTSGVALYFAQAIKDIGATDVLPRSVHDRLEQNLADSRNASNVMFIEFCRINAAFGSTAAPYAVHKGFSLVPDYCPDPSLRTQVDFDFQVCPEHVTVFAEVLRSLGYHPITNSRGEERFETIPGHIPHLRDIYRPKTSFRTELHFGQSSAEDTSELLKHGRCRVKYLNGASFPVLPQFDEFLDQTNHIIRHSGGGWIRTSCLLEMSYFIRKQREDSHFWANLKERCATDGTARYAVGLALGLMLATFPAPDLAPAGQFVEALSPEVQLWVRCCGRKFALAKFPGTKLHLLLDQATAKDLNEWRRSARRRLFPIKKPAQVGIAIDQSLAARVKAAYVQTRWEIGRVNFHVVQSCRLWCEYRKWRHALQTIQKRQTSSN